MDLFEVQEMIKKQFPDKNVSYEMDAHCQRTIEIILTDSNPNVVHHIEHNKVKVCIEGMEPYYLPILPHRMNYTWSAIKEMLNKKNDVFIHPTELDYLKNCPSDGSDYKDKITQLMSFTGLSQADIEKKL